MDIDLLVWDALILLNRENWTFSSASFVCMEPIRNATVSMLAVSVRKWYHNLMCTESSAATDRATGFSFYKGPHNASKMTIARWTAIDVPFCWEQPETQELWGHHNYLHLCTEEKVTSWVVWHSSLCTFPLSVKTSELWEIHTVWSIVTTGQRKWGFVRLQPCLSEHWWTRSTHGRHPPPIIIIAKL